MDRVFDPLSAPLFDTHCHVVEGVFGDADQVDTTLARARAAGVQRFLVVGSGQGADSGPAAVAVAERHPDVWASAGLHPHDAGLWTDAVAAELRRVCAHPRVVAVGELGLDYFYDLSSPQDQRRALDAQVGLGLELDLPLIVHDRDSGGETLDLLRRLGAFDGAGVLWHCFTGDLDLMRGVVDAGGLLSLSGIVTFGSAAALREVAAAVPLDRLLIETDSPWLSPVPVRGRRNEPAHVAHVAACVADCRGMAVAALAQATWANANRLFRLPLA